MWGVVHACCSMAFPLVLTAPVVVLVVLCAASLQYVSDTVCTRARSAVVRVCHARSKHAPYLLALLTLIVCSMFPVASGGSAPSLCLLPFRTQFDSSHAVVASATSQINRVGVFNAFIPHRDPSDHNDTRITVGPDSFADVSLIDPSVVDPSWESVDLPPVSVSGFDGLSSNLLVKAVKVPLRLQWGAPINPVDAFVAPTPANVDFLMGCDVMDAFGRGTTIDRGATRVVFPSERLSVPLETIQSNLSRVNAAPQRVLTTCSGCNFVYCTMRNLGYSIKEWHSIDIDPACRAVTAQIVTESQLVLFEPCHDVSRLPPKL